MILGSYKESTGLMTILPSADNSALPGVISTEGYYFVVERITAGPNSGDIATYNAEVFLAPNGSQQEISNGGGNNQGIPLASLVSDGGGGLVRTDGKPILILNPNEQVSVIVYNRDASATLSFSLELEGYYADENGKRYGISQLPESLQPFANSIL